MIYKQMKTNEIEQFSDVVFSLNKCLNSCEYQADCPNGSQYCCDGCCVFGCYGEDRVVSGVVLSSPNEDKGAFYGEFPSDCKVATFNESQLPLPSIGVQYCSGEECPEGYVPVTVPIRLYNTDGSVLSEEPSICCPISLYEDPCA